MMGLKDPFISNQTDKRWIIRMQNTLKAGGESKERNKNK